MGGLLLLEDGRRFEGEAFGARGIRVGEVVFNTAMTGFQEILTDPSYHEQIVIMTYPHIGNTGVNTEDPESSRVWASGFVAREFSRRHSSHRAEEGLDHYLRAAAVPGLQGIDTRALVRHIRSAGAMKGVICTDGSSIEELQAVLDAWPGMAGRALAAEVSSTEVAIIADPPDPRLRVTVVDGGAKRNITRLLKLANCRVRTAPITASSDVWLGDDSDLVLFSNGPGDPAALPEVIDQIRATIGKKPLVGICLGHQLLALALGAETFKLRFGHRGANHPVRDLQTGRVEITSQNHGFCVEPDSLKATGAEVTHINLNDQTVAGFRHDDKQVMGIQFHPEACPGPRDAGHLIVERFLSFAR
ncbi:MAG: carbamoyl-phosphate synthase small subunit [Myxococcota bacterium]|jgi:carbamoyl-phosphate synthase small subunit